MSTTTAAAAVTTAALAALDPKKAQGQLKFPNTGVVVSLALAGGGLALLMAIWLVSKVRSAPKADESTKEGKQMVKLAAVIQEGAKSFLRTEYKYLTIFCIVFGIVLLAIFSAIPIDGAAGKGDSLDGVRYMGCFFVGAILSAAAGWGGMVIATDANVRTTYAAQKDGLDAALKIAFAGGSVMGFTVVGLGIVGLCVMYVLMVLHHSAPKDTMEDPMRMSLAFQYLTGFGFGASSIALFARVAGGIYTKAADVGADLVGKVEEDLDEDHPNNPAVIADNVGDNVGDVAGMGADLFESYVGSIIAAGSLAQVGNTAMVAYPFWIAGSGIIAAAIGSQLVSTKEGASQTELLHSLHRGINVATLLAAAFAAVITWAIFNTEFGWKCYGCVLIGLVAGILIGMATELFTSYAFQPVQSITQSALTGPATVIIQGLGMGMLSCLPPALIMVVTIVACDVLAGSYGVAIAAVGMLATLGVTLATDAYGPVADNAGGIAEMCGLPEHVREKTDALDALGNTTAATGKGFAIGSAVLTALSLLATFKKDSGLAPVRTPGSNATLALEVSTDVADPIVLGGILFGSVLPLVFAALTMLSVRKAATSIILEVRRQFQANPRLLEEDYEGTGKDGPDYERCIAISTQTSVNEMILPGGLAILSPLFIGFLVGPKCLAGALAGAIGTGFMMAVMMSNAGGAWDNAKKYVELDAEAKKKYGGKGTDVHKACVVGDTVGDPFKDTSGPALNILIKLMSMVSLVFAPLMKTKDWETWYVGLIIGIVIIVLCVSIYFWIWKGFEEGVEKQQKEFDRVKAERLAAAGTEMEEKPKEEAAAAAPAEAATTDNKNETESDALL
jgi:H(+)-translocating pyrophosphatase